MKSHWRPIVAAGIGVCMLSLTLASNESGAPPEDQQSAVDATDEAAFAKPVNLTVLAKNIRPGALKTLMIRYARGLGVRCVHCHVEDPQTRRIDYASDENPAKQKARVMIAMLNDINAKYLSQLDDPRYIESVSCGSCHQGQPDPPTFDPKSKR